MTTRLIFVIELTCGAGRLCLVTRISGIAGTSGELHGWVKLRDSQPSFLGITLSELPSVSLRSSRKYELRARTWAKKTNEVLATSH